jgi:hypothetical protein
MNSGREEPATVAPDGSDSASEHFPIPSSPAIPRPLKQFGSFTDTIALSKLDRGTALPWPGFWDSADVLYIGCLLYYAPNYDASRPSASAQKRMPNRTGTSCTSLSPDEMR